MKQLDKQALPKSIEISIFGLKVLFQHSAIWLILGNDKMMDALNTVE